MTANRFLLVVAAGLVLAGAVAVESPWAGSDDASASDGGPEMRLAVKSGGECEAGTCTIPLGGSFTLAVEIVSIPDGGYVLAQTYIDMGTGLIYKPSATSGDEFVWPDCGRSVVLRTNVDETRWLHGCLTGVIPPLPPSTYTGNFIELKVNCSEGDSSTEVELIDSEPQFTNGSGTFFAGPDGSKTVPKTSNITVVCGGGQGPTNTPRPPTETPTANPSDAEMRLTIKEGADCDGDTCTVPRGASFTLAVEMVDIPDEGYVLVQSYIEMGSDLDYKRAEAETEFVWPDCKTSPIRLLLNPNETGLLHGCLTGLLPPLPPSTYIGNFIELKMNCPDADSTTEVRLLPFVIGERTGGALFVLFDGSTGIPKTSNVTVVCGSGQGPTNTPRPPTGTPPPTDTPVPPTPTQVPPTSTPALFGDANCDGIVDAKDASLVLQRDAGLLGALPCDQKVDVNNDGLLNSLDAALILQFAADLIQQLPVGNTD